MKGIVFGEGDAAKYVFAQRKNQRLQPILIGMSAERHWMEDSGDVSAFVFPGNFRHVASTAIRLGIDELCFIGRPLNSVRPQDYARNSLIILRSLIGTMSRMPLNYDLLIALEKFLERQSIKCIHLREIFDDMNPSPGDIIGSHLRADPAAIMSLALQAREKSARGRPEWFRQSAIVLSSGKVILEVDGIRNRIRSVGRQLGGLRDCYVTKASVPGLEHLDSPVVGPSLVRICLDEGVSGIIAEAKHCLVIDRDGIVAEIGDRDFGIYFL